jgi:uncharacterized protein YbcI
VVTPGKRGSGGRIHPPLSFLSPDPNRRREARREPPVSSTENAPTGSVTAAISNATVKLLHEYTGRGPTRARTYINENLITVVLEDTLTMGERSLVRDGEIDLVMATRKAFQRTMGPELVAAVERASGRKVFAFLSDNRADPDVAVESFVLVPRAERAPSGDDSGD